jgi:hypothetical protein
LSDVSPVQSADSGLAQHMAVMKDFLIPVSGVSGTNPPAITSQPQNLGIPVGATAAFSVTASGASLTYQWMFNGTNIVGATTNPFVLAGAQIANSGNYSVAVSNSFGGVVSSNAALTVTNAPLAITVQPQSQSVLLGQGVTFNVSATGTLPITYQWLLGGTNITGATTNPFVLSNAQTTNAGNYSVILSNVSGAVTSSVAALTVLTTNAAVFVQWNFNSVPPDNSTSTGSTTPSIGTGTATAIGGVTPSFVGGDTTLDPAPSADNTAWTTVNYPASTANNKSAGVQFAVSTAGKQNIVIFWSQRSSNTGGKYFRLQWSTNSGASFADFATAVTVGVNFSAFTNSLPSGANNNSNFVFRIVGEFQSTATGSGTATYIGANGTYAPAGTSRFDMVSISGTAIITGGPATIAPPVVSAGQISFDVTGTPSVSYVVQTSTDLVGTNWLSVFTNASPFTFTDTNLSATQQFYRVIAP